MPLDLGSASRSGCRMSQFTSFAFLLFVVPVWALYRLLPHRGQNILLLVASYVFYASWDWRFGGLILLSTVVDYISGRLLGRDLDSRVRRLVLTASIVINLGFLAFFKYFGFFTETMHGFLADLGLPVAMGVLDILLPVGISFYTFQTMSYTIDVYRRRMPPVTGFIDFALYVSFFPQLVAGPIERAARFMPQILNPRQVTFDCLARGCTLLLYGYFLKVVVADNCAIVANQVFAQTGPVSQAMAWLGTYAFAFQIFGDFAGYTCIARGIAACLGFDLSINFRAPYMATSPSDFWRRWHISLSQWFRDFLYQPLGGNRCGVRKTVRNLAITMLLVGLWHGAAWTFVVWGAYHGLLLSLYRIFDRAPIDERSAWKRCLMRLLFFHLVCLGWIVFRADSLPQALSITLSLFGGGPPTHATWVVQALIRIAPWIAVVTVIQALQYRSDKVLVMMGWPLRVRVAVYLFFFYAIVIFGVNDAQSFIYFQF